MSAATAPITHAPPALWAAARALIGMIFQLFGGPELILAKHMHTRAERKQLLKWLRAGEAWMRQVLLIEAAALPKPNAPSWRHRVRAVCEIKTFDPDKPETWRVRFVCLDRKRAPGARRFKLPKLPKHLHAARPLAERAEALLRAFNNPAPRAKRLSRRLHAKPRRVSELTRHASRARHLVSETDFHTNRAAVTQAALAFNTS